MTTDNAIVHAVIAASKVLDDHIGYMKLEDRFAARATLITEQTLQVARDDSPLVALQMLLQQVTVFLDEHPPAQRDQLFRDMIIGLAKNNQGPRP